MSFVRAEVEDRLRAFAKEAYPGTTWIFADQAGDRPPRPFGTIKIIDASAIGHADVVNVGTGPVIDEVLREQFEINVSFQAFGKNALDIITALRTHARRPSTLFADRQTLSLGFMRAGLVRDLAEVISGDWEGRAQCDFLFSARFDTDRTLETVASVEISGAERIQLVEVP